MKALKKMDQIARNMRNPINTAAISILAVYTFLWGLWLVLPWSTFATGYVFSAMAHLAPEWMWGIDAMFTSTIMMYGVAKDSYKPLRRGSLAGFYYWLTISFMFFVGAWQGVSWITSLMIAVYCAFITSNIKVNKDLHDNNKRNTM
jgi:hypothetical protein